MTFLIYTFISYYRYDIKSSEEGSTKQWFLWRCDFLVEPVPWTTWPGFAFITRWQYIRGGDGKSIEVAFWQSLAVGNLSYFWSVMWKKYVFWRMIEIILKVWLAELFFKISHPLLSLFLPGQTPHESIRRKHFRNFLSCKFLEVKIYMNYMQGGIRKPLRPRGSPPHNPPFVDILDFEIWYWKFDTGTLQRKHNL